MKNLMLSSEQKNQEEEYFFPYHYLDVGSEIYKDIHYIPYKCKLQLIKSKIGTNKKIKVLDAGCGDGRFVYEIKNDFPNVEGIDYSENALGFARAFNPKIKFYRKDLLNIDSKKKYDVITLVDTLEHFPQNKIKLLLNNINNLLVPNGKLIITVPSVNQKLSSKHYQHFTLKKLNKILKPSFKVIEAKGYRKLGISWFIFNNFKNLCVVLHPFKPKIFFIKNILSFLKKLYIKKISVTTTKKSMGILVVCKKTQ